jgi:hypothetical protein
MSFLSVPRQYSTELTNAAVLEPWKAAHTFDRIVDYPSPSGAASADPNDAVAEVTIIGGVPDLAVQVVTVERFSGRSMSARSISDVPGHLFACFDGWVSDLAGCQLRALKQRGLGMPRIFLSHSSSDNCQAVALKQWLAEQRPELANEIFLDIDPESGLQVGARWKGQLFESNSRCEAVICLVSRAWDASYECKAEYRTAEGLGKQILVARLGGWWFAWRTIFHHQRSRFWRD